MRNANRKAGPGLPLLATALLFNPSLLTPLTWLFPAHARAESLGFSISKKPSAGSPTVQIRDDETGKTLTGAQVSFQQGPNLTWILTVKKEGYVPVILAGVPTSRVTVALKRLEARAPAPGVPVQPLHPTVIATGDMGDYHVTPDGSQVRAGLVLRQLSVFDLMHFQTDTLISPIKDTIDLLGSRHVPSNIVFPDQRIDVLFSSYRLNKPTFRLPVRSGIETGFFGIQGQMSVSDLISIGLGGSIGVAALNQLHFSRIGITDSLLPNGTTPFHVPTTMDLVPSYRVTVNPAPFHGDLVVAAITDLQGDRQRLVPTDIKVASSDVTRSETAEVKSTTRPFGAERAILAIAMADKGNRLSGIIIPDPAKNVQTGDFLSAEAPGTFTPGSGRISLSPTPQGISVMTLESSYQPQNEGGKEAKYPVATVYALPEAGSISVPASTLFSWALEGQRLKGPALADVSISHLDFGNGFDPDAVDGRKILLHLNRFTRSIVKPAR